MSQNNLTFEEIVSLITIFESSREFNRMHLKYLDLDLELVKKGVNLDNYLSNGSDSTSTEFVAFERIEDSKLTKLGANSNNDRLHNLPKSTDNDQDSRYQDLLKITSPMVGTFYSSPEPGAEPFVSVGQKVDKNTQVCIIEVMKLMSSIEAGVSGTVVEVNIKNNEPVEFGQVLFWVRPD